MPKKFGQTLLFKKEIKMISISSQEVVTNGKSIIYYKTGLMPVKKTLIPVNCFERAVQIEKVIKQALNWKLFSFRIDKVIESWDSSYFKISLNGEFLDNRASNLDAKEYIFSLMKKLEWKKYTIDE